MLTLYRNLERWDTLTQTRRQSRNLKSSGGSHVWREGQVGQTQVLIPFQSQTQGGHPWHQWASLKKPKES